jgi:phospholipid/cholesterol/gamma-HCH transport system ATP-binding protein
MPIIELKNVSKKFGSHHVLRNVSLAIEEGVSLVVIGASGTGKSVLLKLIVGLLRPDSGQVYFDGKRIDNCSERSLVPVRRNFGFLFQQGALFDSMTVEQNVAFPLVELTTKSPEEIDRVVENRLTMIGLPDSRAKMPGELSGGQRKRVALARAIALEPRVILYDEPTTGLDPIRADVINELILKLNKQLNVTSVTVTHDMNSVFKIADRVVMLHDCHLVFDGTTSALRTETDPIVSHFVRGQASAEDLATLGE